MRATLVSILVLDQKKAEKFYTEILGCTVATDVMYGESRWLTLAMPNHCPGCAELSLEPIAGGADFIVNYQSGLFAAKIPLTSFEVEDLQQEYERLTKAVVEFTSAPKRDGDTSFTQFNDTVGNWIMLHQVHKTA